MFAPKKYMLHLHKYSDPLLSTLLKHLWQRLQPRYFLGMTLQCLAKVFTPLAFFLFCFIATCNLNGFLFGFLVVDIHKIVQIGEVKCRK